MIDIELWFCVCMVTWFMLLRTPSYTKDLVSLSLVYLGIAIPLSLCITKILQFICA